MNEGVYKPIAAIIPPEVAVSLEDAIASIARLDARVSASSVARPWRLRAAWTGYARGLQLHGIEIDEIDVFSWGCGLPAPNRQRRASQGDEFGAFHSWWDSLQVEDDGQWRDQLPFTPTIALDIPILLRAVDLMRQYARRTGSIHAWLALPRFLHRLRLTDTPLPCLVGGAKALRMPAQPSGEVLRTILRGIAAAARRGLETLDIMETAHRRAMRAILDEHRPGALVRLHALSLSIPLLSPKMVAEKLDLSLSGAGKLLDRAGTLGLLVEVSGRKTWKTYLVPDLAITFGYSSLARGRPRQPPPNVPADRGIALALDAFDREMAEIDRRLRDLSGRTTRQLPDEDPLPFSLNPKS